MTTNTMVAIQSVTLGSTQASITLGVGNTIPQTYTDLFLVINGTGTGSTGNAGLQVNGDTSTSYTSGTRILGNGSAASSARQTTGQYGYIPIGDIDTTNFVIEVNLLNYTNSTTYKTILSRSNSSNYVSSYVGLYSNPTKTGITQLTVVANGQSFAAGTTATLYGIANADIGAYATGGIITQDSTYYYHAFGSSGTFTPSRALTADILVVAGGGGGGANLAGGGGAGGVVAFASQSLASGTGYACTIGSGGSGSTNNANLGGSGTNSTVIGGAISLSATGGGGGGSLGNANGANGGSGGGGGGGYNSGTGGSGGTGSQGSAGGTGASGTGGQLLAGAGGGGAGGIGGNGSGVGGSGAGGNGGAAISTVTNWGALAALIQATGYGYNGAIAGGGSGGSNGTTGTVAGGAGAGGTSSTNAANALVNTGSGGGGGGNSFGLNGGNGGSGLIVLRYAK